MFRRGIGLDINGDGIPDVRIGPRGIRPDIGMAFMGTPAYPPYGGYGYGYGYGSRRNYRYGYGEKKSRSKDTDPLPKNRKEEKRQPFSSADEESIDS